MRKLELEQRVDLLKAIVEVYLPEFTKSVKDAIEQNIDMIILHQDAFGADYQDEEYRLLGKAIKYAGLYGKEVRIIDKNRETLNT